MSLKIAVVYSHHKLGDLIWQLPYLKSISKNFSLPITLITRPKTQAKDILKDNLELPKVTLDKFENRDVAKIFYDEDKNIYLNDAPININDLRKKIKTSEIKEVVLIADKSLLVRDINIILFELKQNEINNIKLLSSLNAN